MLEKKIIKYQNKQDIVQNNQDIVQNNQDVVDIKKEHENLKSAIKAQKNLKNKHKELTDPTPEQQTEVLQSLKVKDQAELQAKFDNAPKGSEFEKYKQA